MTDAEKLLWQYLRNRQMGGIKFRRQHPVDKFILDFYSHECKLAIELDGGQHLNDEHFQYDKLHTELLNQQGIKVMRFYNNDVLTNINGVLETLLHVIKERNAPSPLGRGNKGKNSKWVKFCKILETNPL